MRRWCFTLCCLLLFALPLAPATATAQETTATVTGTVTDQSGAIVLMNAPAEELFTVGDDDDASAQRIVQSNDAHFSSFISGLLLGETGPGEIRRGEIVVLLGRTVARNLFGDGDPLDQTIRVRNVPFKVIGVMASKGQSAFGQDQDDAIFVPLDAGRELMAARAQADACEDLGLEPRQVRGCLDVQELLEDDDPHALLVEAGWPPAS